MGLLVLLKSPSSSGIGLRSSSPALFHLLLILSYMALILNASASVSSVLIIDNLGGLAFRRRDPPTEEPKSGRHLLNMYGAEGVSYSGIELHCMYIHHAAI